MSLGLRRLVLCWTFSGLPLACSGGYMNLDLFEGGGDGGRPNLSTANGGKGGSAGTASTTLACASRCDDETPYCSTPLNRCVECLKHADCTETDEPLCNSATGTCVACLSRLDCHSSDAPICSPLTNRCVACMTSSDCEDGASCQPAAGVCIEPCTSSNDCEGEDDALVCDPDSLQCVQCLEDSDCAVDLRPCDTGSHRCAAN
jgi:hypothetical protein